MTRSEMLKQIGLTHEELRDLVHKFAAFHRSLNKPQRAAIDRSIPAPSQAAATFGPDVTAEQLEKLFGVELSGDTTITNHTIGLSAIIE